MLHGMGGIGAQVHDDLVDLRGIGHDDIVRIVYVDRMEMVEGIDARSSFSASFIIRCICRGLSSAFCFAAESKNLLHEILCPVGRL